MLRTSESETEILLGNKQLVGIFLVVALLLAVAFYGGYMVGRGGSTRKSIAASKTEEEAAAAPSSTGGRETHVVPAGSGASDEQNGVPEKTAAAKSRRAEEPLGKRKASARAESQEAEPAAGDGFAPQVGEQFLQVVAVSRDEAQTLADVLHKKGFRAHAVPKPGNPKIYRVIIGPIRDTAELSSTREALMHNGFREVILQRY